MLGWLWELLNEQTSFNPLPGKAEIEHHSNFENLRAVLVMDTYVLIYFVKSVIKIVTS